MACPMRRKKRSLDLVKDALNYYSDFNENELKNSPWSDKYRPATIDEVMRICCDKGCEFTDFFPYCGPFADW